MPRIPNKEGESRQSDLQKSKAVGVQFSQKVRDIHGNSFYSKIVAMAFKAKEYPPNWKTEIRPRILERAGNCCEVCGIENGAVGWRLPDGSFCYADDYLKVKKNGYGFYVTTGRTKIVLTIAHWDNPDKMDCREENLKAACQRCHLLHDLPDHIKSARLTRERKSMQLKLEL